jgi:predicted CXXCH cytochrome family protein
MNKNGILLCLLVIVLLSAGIAKADMPDGHKPVPCVGCHKETIGADAGPGECGNCHDYVVSGKGIDVPKMQEQHNPNICRACHIGNTIENASNRDLVHNAHNIVQCSTCHVSGNATHNNSTDGITIVKIEPGKAFQCTSCHGNQIHAIHMKNLSQGCPICHGSWASGKVYSADASPSQDISQENAIYERFTIFAFIKNLFNALLGIR